MVADAAAAAVVSCEHPGHGAVPGQILHVGGADLVVDAPHGQHVEREEQEGANGVRYLTSALLGDLRVVFRSVRFRSVRSPLLRESNVVG